MYVWRHVLHTGQSSQLSICPSETELGPGEHCLGIAQGVDLLCARRLADREVVKQIITAPMELAVVVLKVVHVLLVAVPIRLCDRQLAVVLCQLLGVVHDLRAERVDGLEAILLEGLVVSLRLVLTLDRLPLGNLGLLDDALEKSHGALGAARLLVFAKAFRRSRRRSA